MEKSLNKTVSLCGYNGKVFEIDQLLDTKNPVVFHLYYMNGSDHGESIGGDFTSVMEAKEYARRFAGYQEGGGENE